MITYSTTIPASLGIYAETFSGKAHIFLEIEDNGTRALEISFQVLEASASIATTFEDALQSPAGNCTLTADDVTYNLEVVISQAFENLTDGDGLIGLIITGGDRQAFAEYLTNITEPE